MVQYYQYPFPPQQPQVGWQQQAPPIGTGGFEVPLIPIQPQLPLIEQSYIENILRLNLGKLATIYMNFENSQWGSKIFKGILEAAGKDHIILSDPVTGMRYLLLSIYLNYVTFDEEIEYEYPFGTLFKPEENQNQQMEQNQTQPNQQPFQRKDDKKKAPK